MFLPCPRHPQPLFQPPRRAAPIRTTGNEKGSFKITGTKLKSCYSQKIAKDFFLILIVALLKLLFTGILHHF